MSITEEATKSLRAPFAEGQVGKLPRITCRKCSRSDGKVCEDHSKSECPECGNWITSRHIHLDYVGHANVTDRLLDVDPEWSWEPVAFDRDGLPAVAVEQNGRRVLWIRLTVCGVTRLGVGIVGGDKPEVEKELIGDALRNAAMRFGVALDLWAKGDLHADESTPPEPSARVEQEPPVDWAALGWTDKEHYAEALAEIRERTRSLPSAQQDEIKAWLSAEGWTQPFTHDQIDGWSEEVNNRLEAIGPDDEGRPF